MFMLKNIISEITADKKKRNIEPTHAILKDILIQIKQQENEK